jgi:UDP-N-acetylmuramate: L-alanyl-gamma-D-glutamyl-meso-diaminopimelate ligase
MPLGFAHSARLGPVGGFFVIEGDEYDTAFFDKRAKFFHYLPEIAVVTSVEFDHGDIYPDLAAIELAFQRMLRQIPREGWLVACADNAAAALLSHAPSQTAAYGLSETADWRGEILGLDGGVTRLAVHHRGTHWGDLALPLAGRHNVLNALAAAVVGACAGLDALAVAEGLRTFPGVRRRMEVFLETPRCVFVDDFAHHPTAIRETIAAARERWPGRRLRVLFEPRSNTTVTRRFQGDMEVAFAQADEVFLGPIFRGEHIAEKERLDREALAEVLIAGGAAATVWDNTDALAGAVLAGAGPADVVLILSNGAFGDIYNIFREACAADSV